MIKMNKGSEEVKGEKKGGKKVYRCEDLIIYWDAEKCIHAGVCWRGLPQVFKPAERPWVKITNADPERIIKVIDPSLRSSKILLTPESD